MFQVSAYSVIKGQVTDYKSKFGLLRIFTVTTIGIRKVFNSAADAKVREDNITDY